MGCPGGSGRAGGDGVGEASWGGEKCTDAGETGGDHADGPRGRSGSGSRRGDKTTSSPLTAVRDWLDGGVCLNSGDGPGVGRCGS